MKVCARDACGVISSGGGEIVTPIVVKNCSRDVIHFSSTVDDADADTDDDDGGTSLL